MFNVTDYVFHLEVVGTMLNLMRDLLFSMNKHLPVYRGNPYSLYLYFEGRI